jgi:glutaredoxin-like protein NrdH
MKQKSITVYSLSTCSTCKALIQWLEEIDARFKAVDVDLLEKDEKTEVMKTVKEHTSTAAFPISVIGDRVIIGYKKEEILSALNPEPISKTYAVKKILLKKLFGA